MLKIIQLGITLADEDGELAKVDGIVSTWQFNFRFSLDDDMYAQDSIELLTKSGIDFAKHTNHGIDVYKFGELLITSGLVMLDEVKWISFHSGYDFGYLVKIMSCTPLPKEEAEFRKKLGVFFPSLYDIKFLMKSCRNLKGGLQDIAEELGIQRIGPQHQAGSDSLLTGMIFFQMKQRFFENQIEDAKYLFVAPPHHSVGWCCRLLIFWITAVKCGVSTEMAPPQPPPALQTAPFPTPPAKPTPQNSTPAPQPPSTPPTKTPGESRNGTPGGYTPAFGKMGM